MDSWTAASSSLIFLFLFLNIIYYSHLFCWTSHTQRRVLTKEISKALREKIREKGESRLFLVATYRITSSSSGWLSRRVALRWTLWRKLKKLSNSRIYTFCLMMRCSVRLLRRGAEMYEYKKKSPFLFSLSGSRDDGPRAHEKKNTSLLLHFDKQSFLVSLMMVFLWYAFRCAVIISLCIFRHVEIQFNNNLVIIVFF